MEERSKHEQAERLRARIVDRLRPMSFDELLECERLLDIMGAPRAHLKAARGSATAAETPGPPPSAPPLVWPPPLYLVGDPSTDARLRAELAQLAAWMSGRSLAHVADFAEFVRRIDAAYGDLPGRQEREASIQAALRPRVAADVVRRWPALIIDAVFAHRHWSEEESLKIIQALLYLLRERAVDGDKIRALEVILYSASYLRTGFYARGRPVLAGAPDAARRLGLVHDVLFGKTADVVAICKVYWIVADQVPAGADAGPLVHDRLSRLDAKFGAISVADVRELLASYTPTRPKKNSGKHSLTAIVAELMVRAGVFVQRRPNAGAKPSVQEVERARKRVESAIKGTAS